MQVRKMTERSEIKQHREVSVVAIYSQVQLREGGEVADDGNQGLIACRRPQGGASKLEQSLRPYRRLLEAEILDAQSRRRAESAQHVRVHQQIAEFFEMRKQRSESSTDGDILHGEREDAVTETRSSDVAVASGNLELQVNTNEGEVRVLAEECRKSTIKLHHTGEITEWEEAEDRLQRVVVEGCRRECEIQRKQKRRKMWKRRRRWCPSLTHSHVTAEFCCGLLLPECALVAHGLRLDGE